MTLGMTRPPPRLARRPTAGLTLLELLVALALMALLAGFAFNLIDAGGRALARGETTARAIDRLLARHELRAILERATLVPQDQGEAIGLSGSTNAFEVPAIVDEGLFWPGTPIAVRVERRGDGAGQEVVMILSGLAESDRQPLERRHPLSDSGAGLTLAYFGSVELGTTPDWHDAWPADAALPLLLRIGISGSDARDPPLIIRPGKVYLQREMSLSSLVPPAAPSAP